MPLSVLRLDVSWTSQRCRSASLPIHSAPNFALPTRSLASSKEICGRMRHCLRGSADPFIEVLSEH